MKNYPFTKIDMFTWNDQTMEQTSITYDLSTIDHIESKMVLFDDSKKKQPAIIIHFITNQTATFDAKNWSIGFI